MRIILYCESLQIVFGCPISANKGHHLQHRSSRANRSTVQHWLRPPAALHIPSLISMQDSQNGCNCQALRPRPCQVAHDESLHDAADTHIRQCTKSATLPFGEPNQFQMVNVSDLPAKLPSSDGRPRVPAADTSQQVPSLFPISLQSHT